MRNYIVILFVVITFLLSIVSCGSSIKDKGEDGLNIDKMALKDSLIKANISLLSEESNLIDNYVIANNIDVVKTGTGLRYKILKEGEGSMINKGDLVTIEYEVRLLNDDLIYSSEKDGVKTFVVGRGGVESGLEEAILKLRKDSEAILIMPSHLAHGFVGDGNKIPQRSALVYKLKVVDNHSK